MLSVDGCARIEPSGSTPTTWTLSPRTSLSFLAMPRSCRPCPRRHHHVDLAVALVEDLLGRALVVCKRVGLVGVLVEDVRVGDELLSFCATPMCESGESHAASVGVRITSAPSP